MHIGNTDRNNAMPKIRTDFFYLDNSHYYFFYPWLDYSLSIIANIENMYAIEEKYLVTDRVLLVSVGN